MGLKSSIFVSPQTLNLTLLIQELFQRQQKHPLLRGRILAQAGQHHSSTRWDVI